MFIAQFFSLLVYFIMKRKYKQSFQQRKRQAAQKGLILNMPKYYLCFPALFDFISSTLQYTALNFISPSIYQMLRGGTIISTFCLSVLLLKAKIQKFQLFGTGLALIGILIVGASNVIFSDSNQNSPSAEKQFLEFILIACSLISNGFLFVYEQKLFSKYHLQPLYVVGMQGLFGLTLYIVILPILSFIPCAFGVDACVFSYGGQSYFQRPQSFFREIGQNSLLLTSIFFGLIAVCLFNIAGVAITKYINALARSICDISRTALIWIFGIIITLTAGKEYPKYDWQLIGFGPNSLQLIGFTTLIFGNLVYNEFITLKILKKDKRQELNQQNDQNTNVQTTHKQNNQIQDEQCQTNSQEVK